MTIKKVILGSVVVLSAMGYAFASASAFAKPGWVHVKFSGATSFVCINSGFLCSESGANVCRIQIPDLSRTTPAYTSNTCSVLTTNSSVFAGSFDPAATIADADL